MSIRVSTKIWGVRGGLKRANTVKNRHKSSLKEITKICMKYIKENSADSPAILFRDLPAKTAEDFSIIAKATGEPALNYQGGTALRSQIDHRAGIYTTSNEPNYYSVELHNEMAYNMIHPSKVIFN